MTSHEQALPAPNWVEREGRYRTLLSLVTSIIWISDPKGAFVEPQPSWEAYTGQPWEEHQRFGWLKMVHPEDRAALADRWSGSARVSTPYEGSARLWHGKSASYRYCEVRARPTLGSAGEVLEWIGAVTDVHERRGEQLRLSEQSRLLRSITDNADVSLFIMDEHQHCVFMNPAAEELTGFRLEEVTGHPLHDVIHHTRPDGSPYPLCECPIDRALPQNDREQGEELFIHKDGHFYPVSFTASPIRDEQGTPIGTVIEVQNISARKHTEARLEELLMAERTARSEAERITRMKDEFLATLSHELRTPLNAILGWSQLLQKRPESKGLEDGLAVIMRNARTQAQMIEDLLEMSRIISGKIRLDLQLVDLQAVVTAAVDTVRPGAEAKSIRLVNILDPNAGTIYGDPNRLQQVVWNLLSNAIRYTPKEGKVRVLLERINSHVEIAVHDSGEGIEPDFLPHVFERFRQQDASTTRRHGGLGLGLSIVKHLVELHGGSVTAASDGPGKGSTFTVTLPIAAVSTLRLQQLEAEELLRKHSTAEPSLAYESEVSLRGSRVLVIDDDRDGRELVARLLIEAGAQVMVAESASAGQKQMALHRFSLVLCDIGMPTHDGYEFVRWLRALPQEDGGGTPAVALTALARAEDRLRALREGYDMHVAKPVEPAELLTVCEALTTRARLRRASSGGNGERPLS